MVSMGPSNWLRRRARGVPAALALGVALSVLTACASPSRDPGGVTVDPNKPDPARTDPAGRLLYFLPADLPDGIEVRKFYDFPVREERAYYQALIAKPTGDGGYDSVIKVAVSTAESDQDWAAVDADPSVDRIDVNGSQARLRDPAPEGVSLAWFLDPYRVTLLGPPGSADDVVDAARRVVLPDDGDPRNVSLSTPRGYELVAEHGIGPFVSSGYFMDLQDRSGEHGRTLIVQVHVNLVPANSHVPAARIIGDHVTFGRIRRASAALSQSTTTLWNEGQSVTVESAMVAWLERPDIAVYGSVSSTEGADLDMLVRILEGLEEVSEEEWNRARRATE